MRKLTTIIVATILTAGALGAWAMTNGTANSVRNAAVSVDPLELSMTAKDLPLQQVDYAF